jgi:hypothetical protein
MPDNPEPMAEPPSMPSLSTRTIESDFHFAKTWLNAWLSDEDGE